MARVGEGGRWKENEVLVVSQMKAGVLGFGFLESDINAKAGTARSMPEETWPNKPCIQYGFAELSRIQNE